MHCPGSSLAGFSKERNDIFWFEGCWNPSRFHDSQAWNDDAVPSERRRYTTDTDHKKTLHNWPRNAVSIKEPFKSFVEQLCFTEESTSILTDPSCHLCYDYPTMYFLKFLEILYQCSDTELFLAL